MKPHAPADCPQDEGCSACVHCYVATGETVCGGCCPHARENAEAVGDLDEEPAASALEGRVLACYWTFCRPCGQYTHWESRAVKGVGEVELCTRCATPSVINPHVPWMRRTDADHDSGDGHDHGGRVRATGMRRFLAAHAGREGCWLWPGFRDREGYGRTKCNGKTAVAHRVAFMLAQGAELAPTDIVLHRCDTPACCNPAHLVVGSQKDNYEDARSKNRNTCGSRAPNAKLTDEAVRDIRTSDLSQNALAQKYGVRQSLIFNVKHRRRWAHVAD